MRARSSLFKFGFISFFVSFYICSADFFTPALCATESLRSLPVQDSGRLKPFDSFSRETLEIIYGKTSLEGREAYEVVLTWLLSPQAWQEKEFFEVRNHEVLAALGLDSSRRYFKGDELFSNEKFLQLRQQLQEKRESKEKLTPFFQALQRLENQYFLFTEMATGRLMKVLPPARDLEAASSPASHAWISVAELSGPSQEAFLEMSKKFIESLSGKSVSSALDQAVQNFEKIAREQNPVQYPSDSIMNLEVHYNTFHPFRWAYTFYLLAAALVLFVWITDKSRIMPVAWVLVAVGFFLHTYGFGLRVYLAQRPPVSNMYETVVWVAWGSLVFSMVLEIIYKYKFILLAGLLVGVFGMVVADSAPAILDPSLQPLEPVLRSSYWLIVHVMTITISYAAFFLAFMLGDLALIYYLRGEKQHQEKIKKMVLSIYRAMQIGVTFLAPGIILGGIWADYSWGRFWGWDPKETWALIVLLGYIAVLHGRLVGWIKDFGMVVTSIISFNLVIMAWYGVNFVLGAGLHSYGFGAGGVEYVSVFILLHIFFVIYVAWVRRSTLSAKTT